MSAADPKIKGNEIADAGKVFLCLACGKRSRDLFGYQKVDSGWDESCMLNAREIEESKLTIVNNRVVKVNQ